ncbi:MAG: hypothetical protein O2922_04340 [Cyanobacteria bacterium]|nr:hypothetical protein [Cyanobacteriota bacterium]
MICLIALKAGQEANAQEAKQTMADAAQAMDVCRTVPKADRDEMVGEQVTRAWLATAPGAAAEKQDKSNLLLSMVDTYSKAMQKDGQFIAMGCSQGVIDRVQNLNWSPFHSGVKTVLRMNGMGYLINP